MTTVVGTNHKELTYSLCLLTSANLVLESRNLIIDVSSQLLGALGHVKVVLLIEFQYLGPFL